MGVKKISGVVIERKRRYLHILRDDSKDGEYDLLTCTGAAAFLEKGDRFTLYVTTASVKNRYGRKYYTFSNPTAVEDGTDGYQLSLNHSEIMLLYSLVKEKINDESKKYGTYNLSLSEKFSDLNSIMIKISENIFK